MDKVILGKDTLGMGRVSIPYSRISDLLPFEAEQLAKEIMDRAKEARAQNIARERSISNGG